MPVVFVIERCLRRFAVVHKIAFQYYPLDLNPTSNPFLISWWPLALGDPALFHVSLQTACLDEELLAQKGFQGSEILMADSVALLRRKVQDPSLAVQDGTMNSVIVLAAIEVSLRAFAFLFACLLFPMLMWRAVWKRQHQSQRNACRRCQKADRHERWHQRCKANQSADGENGELVSRTLP